MAGIDDNLGQAVRNIRELQHLSIADLAAAASVKKDSLQRLETGTQAWTVNVLLPVCRTLGVDVKIVLLSAGLSKPDTSIEETILADPGMPAHTKQTLIGLVRQLRGD